MLVFNNFTIPIHHVSDVSLLLSLSLCKPHSVLHFPLQTEANCCVVSDWRLLGGPGAWPRPAISWYDQWQHDRLWQCRMEGVKIHWTVTAWTPAPDWSLTPEAESPDVCVPSSDRAVSRSSAAHHGLSWWARLIFSKCKISKPLCCGPIQKLMQFKNYCNLHVSDNLD